MMSKLCYSTQATDICKILKPRLATAIKNGAAQSNHTPPTAAQVETEVATLKDLTRRSHLPGPAGMSSPLSPRPHALHHVKLEQSQPTELPLVSRIPFMARPTTSMPARLQAQAPNVAPTGLLSSGGGVEAAKLGSPTALALAQRGMQASPTAAARDTLRRIALLGAKREVGQLPWTVTGVPSAEEPRAKVPRTATDAVIKTPVEHCREQNAAGPGAAAAAQQPQRPLAASDAKPAAPALLALPAWPPERPVPLPRHRPLWLRVTERVQLLQQLPGHRLLRLRVQRLLRDRLRCLPRQLVQQRVRNLVLRMELDSHCRWCSVTVRTRLGLSRGVQLDEV